MLTSLLLLALPLQARTFAGVTLPDTASVGGQTVTLNGMGLREKFFVDVYVGGLYLTTPTHDANTAITVDQPKRVVMHFVYSTVTHDQMIESFEEQFAGLPSVAAQKPNIDKMYAWVPAELHRGDEIVFDYVPGAGTSMVVKGKTMGTLAGTDFMKMLFSVYLGPKPPTEALKNGLLGT